MKWLLWIASIACVINLGALAWMYVRAQDASAAVIAQQTAEREALEAKQITAALQMDATRLRAEAEKATQDNVTLKRALARAKEALPDAHVTSVAAASTGVVAAETPVALGTRLDLRVSEITVRSEAGTLAMVGSAEVWRLDPPPETLVARGELRGRYVVEALPPPVQKGWPTWAVVGAGIAGVIVGGAVSYQLTR
jgi:hypothetical protein